jgi:hypothetical protein
MQTQHTSLPSGLGQRRRVADRSVASVWPNERRVLEVLDAVLIAFLLVPFLLV